MDSNFQFFHFWNFEKTEIMRMPFQKVPKKHEGLDLHISQILNERMGYSFIAFLSDIFVHLAPFWVFFRVF